MCLKGEICGYRCCDYEYCCLLGCENMQFGGCLFYSEKEAARSSETSVDIYQTMRGHIRRCSNHRE
jgi:hypothetical protein